MWSVVLCVEKSELSKYINILKTLKPTYKSGIFIDVKFSDSNRVYIAINDTNYIDNVNKYVVEGIITTLKHEYIRSKLNAKNMHFHVFDFFINSLLAIGLKEEVDYVLKKNLFRGIVCVRSMACFRLVKLYSLWDRLIDYVNKYVLLGDDMQLSALKFVADAISGSEDVVKISFEDDTIRISNITSKDNYSVLTINYLKVIEIVIMMCPKKIIIDKFKEDKHDDLIDDFRYVFGNALCVMH
ncbi:MAG: hypothetical protein E7356_00540 [Clostridiales bacterium]|nr:hypothetical protein [Clostridiales bacterium]